MLDAVFGRVVRLEGVTIEREIIRPGDYLRIWLHWQSIAPTQEDLSSIGQLVVDGWRVWPARTTRSAGVGVT